MRWIPLQNTQPHCLPETEKSCMSHVPANSRCFRAAVFTQQKDNSARVSQGRWKVPGAPAWCNLHPCPEDAVRGVRLSPSRGPRAHERQRHYEALPRVLDRQARRTTQTRRAVPWRKVTKCWLLVWLPYLTPHGQICWSSWVVAALKKKKKRINPAAFTEHLFYTKHKICRKNKLCRK